MANALYPKWKEAIMQASTNSKLATSAPTARVAFSDTGTYTYSASHQFYSSLSGMAPSSRATGVALANLTFGSVSASVFDADDATFSALSNSSVSVEAIILYLDDGSADATSRLCMYLDSSITGMPFTPSGADVTIQWNASGIFAL